MQSPDTCSSNDTSCFLQYASLDQGSFFAALTAAGFPDMSKLKLAGFLFRGLSMSSASSNSNATSTGVSLHQFQEVLQIAVMAKAMYENHLPPGDEGISLPGFHQMALSGLQETTGEDSMASMFPKLRNLIMAEQDAALKNSSGSTSSTGSRGRSSFVRSALDEDVFARYSDTNTGLMDLSHFLAYCFSSHILCEVFTEVAGDETKLNKDTFTVALQKIGIASLQRTNQGQFMDAVFTRTDLDRSGGISYSEFGKAGMSLIYPARHHSYVNSIRGYPGWSGLATRPSVDPNKIAELISTLNTGDVLILQDLKGPMSQFINFSLNTPWCHASVVVRRSPLTGIPNAKTEEYLQQYPFRRASHHFCSPGYCRCFDATEGDFAPSKFTGLGHIGLLESTGEGIHLYDLAHRLLESGAKEWASIAVARLNDAPGRDDTAKINQFIESVRGGIYTVAKDELKAAVAYHYDGSPSSTIRMPSGGRGSDDFCASLVQRFYHHMGWVDGSRPFNSVMPCDYDMEAEVKLEGTVKCPVELLKGQGWLSPLELVMCSDLNASLPLKLPKKKA